jgi:hypothetical protein
VNFPCKEVALIDREEVKFVENNNIVVSLVDPIFLAHDRFIYSWHTNKSMKQQQDR